MSTPVVTSSGNRRARWRWAVAAVATGALVISGSGLVAFAQSGAGESRGPQFVPATAVGYVEARLDLPGGQDEALAQLLTAFPGFADPGSFQMKLDEALAMVSEQLGASMPEGDLIGDVLSGEVGLALTDAESLLSGGDPTVLVGLAVADPEAAGSLFEALVAQSETPFSQETYNDVVIYTDASSEQPLSVALHGDWMLMGTGSAAVSGAVDVLDGAAEGLAADPDFLAAWARLPEARLGAAYMDFAPFASFFEMAVGMAEGQTGMALPTQDLAAMMPTDFVASLVAENDRLTLEALVTPGEQTPTVAIGESDLAASFPAETQVYLETRELGATIEAGFTQLAAMMAAMETTEDPSGAASELGLLFGEESPITAMLGVPLPQYLDFVADAGVGVGLSSDGLWLGIAAEVNDEAVAAERVASLNALLAMFLMGAEEQGMSIETSTVGDVEVTSIVAPFDQMLAEAGVPLSVGDSVDFALAGDRLLIGLGDFVESAIVADAAASLGATEGYLDALGEDVPNSGVVYVNIGSLLAAFEPMLAMMGPEWEQFAPYATAFDRMIVVGTADDEVLRSRMTVIVGS